MLVTFNMRTWSKIYVSAKVSDKQMKAVEALLPLAFAGFQKGMLSFTKAPITMEATADRVRFSGPESSVDMEVMKGFNGLETRPDLDHSRIAITASSAGAHGLILAAIEPRYRAVAMAGAGLPAYTIPFFAAANPINFASHIRAPKLLVQGRYDEDSPVRTTSDPLFKLLVEPKRRVLFEGGHVRHPRCT
jgi:hypothetical protein